MSRSKSPKKDAGPPPPEITYNALYVLLDVSQGAIDFDSVVATLKENPRKDVEFVNACEFIDPKLPKTSSSDDIVLSAVRNMRAKLDGDMQKSLDAKKKFQAALEKQKKMIEAALAKKKKPPTIKNPLQPEEPRYDGKADILYVIYNIGFTPRQVELLREGGFPFLGFIALVPENPEFREFSKDAIIANTNQQVPMMPAMDLSFTRSPSCYPPARWQALKPELGLKLLFREIRVDGDAEAAIRAIQNEVVRMINANESFDYFIKEKSFKDVEVYHEKDVDTSIFMSFVDQHPRDYVNGLWSQLKVAEFKTRPPIPPEEVSDVYSKLFDNEESCQNRKFIFKDQEEPEEPYFTYPFIPQVYYYLYNLIKWRPNDELAPACEVITKFIANPQNFYAYAGQRFDSLVTTMNKKYSLGLPNVFYDFQKWNLATFHSNAAQVLSEAIHDAAAIESVFDNEVGILWMMVMKPVTKVTGQFVTQYSMPQTLCDSSDWLSKVYDHRNDEEQKVKLVNPAIVAKGNLDTNQLLKSLRTRIESTNLYYKMPIEVSNEAHFRTPYFLDNGMHAEITRDVTNGKLSFHYSLFFKDALEINGNIDTIVYQPVESIRLHTSSNEFGITIFFNEQMLYYNGENLVLETIGVGDRMLITPNGSIISLKKNLPIIVESTGAISRKVDGQWEYVDKDGEAFKNWRKEKKPHSQTKDLSTGTISMIRPDNIEYYILKNGTRKIIINNDFSIEQTEKAVDFDIQSFPIIHVEDEKITMKIDRFDLKFDAKHFTFNCSNYLIEIADQENKVKINNSDINLTPTRCEVKYENTVFVADESGIEKIATLLTEEGMKKKKLDIISTSFGPALPNKEANAEPVLLNLHTKFPARFFGIRSDFSIVEFLRSDILPERVEKKATLKLPNQEQEVQLITRHKLKSSPTIYIENEPLSKPARSTLLKEVKVPKGTKNKPVTGTRPVEETMKMYYDDLNQFLESLNEKLRINEEIFIKENTPKELLPPEKLRAPPQTPPVRIQLMQYNLYQPKLGETDKYNYWNCHESDFGFPLDETKALPRPLSPRTKMFDPPRESKEKEQVQSRYEFERINFTAKKSHADDIPKNDSSGGQSETGSFITEPTVPLRFKDFVEEDQTPQVIRCNPPLFDFGDVSVNQEKDIYITLTNVGTRPIHYGFNQIQNKYVKLASLPGAIFPGLKVRIKVHLNKVPEAQSINTVLNFNSRLYCMKIPIKANITK